MPKRKSFNFRNVCWHVDWSSAAHCELCETWPKREFDCERYCFTCDETDSRVTILIHVWRYWVTCDDIVSRVTILLHWRRYWFTCDDTDSRVTILIHVWRYLVTFDDIISRVTILLHWWRNWFTCDDTVSLVTILIHVWRYWVTCDDTVTRVNSRSFPCIVCNILYVTIWNLMVAMYTTEVTFKLLCFELTWRTYVYCMIPRTWGAFLF